MSLAIQVEKITIGNGITVLLDRTPMFQSVACAVCLLGGSCDETLETIGITHLLEHLLFKQTKHKSTKDIALTIDQFGGCINAYTDTNALCLYGVVPRRRHEDLLRFFSELLWENQIVDRQLEVEKEIVRQEILESLDDPDDFLYQQFQEKLWPHSLLGLPVFGTLETVERFGRAALEKRRGELLVGKKLVVVLVGDIELLQVERMLKEIFPEVPLGQRVLIETPKFSSGVHVCPRAMSQAQFMLGCPWPGFRSDDYLAGLVLSSVLGDSSASRLFQALREERGLAYSVYTDIDSYHDASAFHIYSAVERGGLQDALAVSVDELEKIANQAITQAELERAVSMFSAQLEMCVDEIVSRLWRALEMELAFERQIPPAEMLSKLQRLQVGDIQEFARKWLVKDNFLLVLGGDIDGFDVDQKLLRKCSGG